jgi:hypothetical protein
MSLEVVVRRKIEKPNLFSIFAETTVKAKQKTLSRPRNLVTRLVYDYIPVARAIHFGANGASPPHKTPLSALKAWSEAFDSRACSQQTARMLNG